MGDGVTAAPPTPRREKCACRGFIEATEADVERAVRAHNAEPLHAEWLAWNDGMLAAPRLGFAPSLASYSRLRQPRLEPGLRRVA